MKPIMIIAVCYVTVMLIINFKTPVNKFNEQQDFEKAMVRALRLRLVCRDTTYEYSTRLKVINDTIVGLWNKTINNKEYKYFFIQSLKNPKYKIEFNNFKLQLPSIPSIDQYRNGCLYFGAFGSSFMQSLCSDGTLTDYFKKYDDTLFYANKIMLYKKLAVIASMNGVFVFDIKSQKLLWKHKYHEDPMEGRSAVIGKKLVFTETMNGFLSVFCFNLETLKIDWSTKIYKEGDYLFNGRDLNSDENNIVAQENYACYTISLQTGAIKGKIPWKKFYINTSNSPESRVQNDRLYVTNYNDSNTLCCFDVTNNILIWQLKNAQYWGLLQHYVLAVTPDGKYFLVVDKLSGKLKTKVLRPKSKTAYFDLIGNYILINHKTLYQ